MTDHANGPKITLFLSDLEDALGYRVNYSLYKM